jgi:VCBS repeat protein/putative peptidoglycan binding protein
MHFRIILSSILVSWALLLPTSAQDNSLLSRDEVRQLQQNLNDLGFDVGRPDGIAGRKTNAALTALYWNYSSDAEFEVDQAAVTLSSGILSSRFAPPPKSVGGLQFSSPGNVVSVDMSQARIPCVPPGCEPMDFVLGPLDLNADGYLDIVMANYYFVNGKATNDPKPVIFLINDGAGRFSVGDVGFELNLVHPREVAIADFNGDGRDDMFIFDAGMDAPPFPGGQNVLILTAGDGVINATDTHLPARVDFSHGGAPGDLDGDGDLDILVITNQSQVVNHDSYVLENDGSGRFSINDHPDYISSSLLSIRSRGADYGLNNSARIFDVDGDGYLDIAWLVSGDDDRTAARKTGAQFSHITYNDGQNRYLNTNTIDLPLARWGFRTFVTDLKQVDIDGDGDLDLLSTSNTRDGFGPWRGAFVDVLENLGGRRFINATHKYMFDQGYTDPEKRMWNHWVFTTDLNLDQRTDFVVFSLDPLVKDSGGRDTTVKIGLLNADRRYDPVYGSDATYQGYAMRRMIVFDVDNDGDEDLVGTSLLQGDDIDGELSFIGFRLQVMENRVID